MKYTVTQNVDGYFILQRDNEIVLQSVYPGRVADLLLDMLENNGKLTLIPEPSKGEK